MGVRKNGTRFGELGSWSLCYRSGTGVPLTLTFDIEFSRPNRILGMGGPTVMERKGRESIGCPDVKHNHYVTSRQRILLGTGVTQDVGVSVDSSSLLLF